MKFAYLSISILPLLVACQSTPEPKPQMPAPKVAQPVFGSPHGTGCDKADWENFIGMKYSGIDFAAGPNKPRILIPGNFYTQDYKADRVNLHADKDGKVTHVTCG